MADDKVDELAYQEKGVFLSNFYEVVRVIKVAATRIINLETKVGAGGGGGGELDPSIAMLPNTVNQLAAVVQALKDEAGATAAKLDKLFPDESFPQPEVPKMPDPVPEPKPAPAPEPEPAPQPAPTPEPTPAPTPEEPSKPSEPDAAEDKGDSAPDAPQQPDSSESDS